MKNPFVVGSWVRGEKFFGRNRILTEILEGRRSSFWILGNRRTGKTSVLKQIEYLTERDPFRDRALSLFWDLQGSADEEGLRTGLHDAILDAEETFSRIGFDIDDVRNRDLFQTLRALKKAATASGKTLFLLCDEAEELLTIGRNAFELLPRLKKLLLLDENVKTVLVATRKLGILAQPFAHTSPFLHGFIPPLYLSSLEEDACWALIRTGGFPYPTAEQIQQLTGRHPFLTQIVCSRVLDGASLESVEREIVNDEMISCFYSEDTEVLNHLEKTILRAILAEKKMTESEITTQVRQSRETTARALYSLQSQGFIRKKAGGYTMASRVYEQWLSRMLSEGGSIAGTGMGLAGADILEARTGAYLPSAAFLPTGEEISHYRIEEHLGSGGMGIVYKATDRKLERTVALKFIRSGAVPERDAQKRFMQEAISASKLNHPAIVTIYEIGEWEGTVFISMEYIEGRNLRQHFRSGPMEVDKTLQVLTEIAEAIEAAHERGIAHMDLKPENVLLPASGSVKIVDFGCARFLNPESLPGVLPVEASGERGRMGGDWVLGTPLYMSPEQIRGTEVDFRADIHALGSLAYELLTGKPPFTGSDTFSIVQSVLCDTPRAPSTHNESVPQWLDAVVLKALEKEPSKRFGSMAELRRVLERN